jgi:16S rRNA processing protein RimM
MIRIGKIVATHGLTGAVVMTHVLGSSKWLNKNDVLHIEMQKGCYIPHFVSNIKANNDKEYLVNIEMIDKVETARKLVTKHVYVDEALLTSFAKQSPLLWIGFTIIDKTDGKLGVVDDVVQTGTQWLARFIYMGKEVLIPLVEQTVQSVDIKSRMLNVDLPAGLLEVYL